MSAAPSTIGGAELAVRAERLGHHPGSWSVRHPGSAAAHDGRSRGSWIQRARYELGSPTPKATTTKEKLGEQITAIQGQLNEALANPQDEHPRIANNVQRLREWISTAWRRWERLPQETEIPTENLDDPPPGAERRLAHALEPLRGLREALNYSFNYTPPKSVDIRQGSYAQSGFTALSNKKANQLADKLHGELEVKGGLGVGETPRKVDMWIKIKVNDFPDGPRVDLEGHQPKGAFPSFQRLRIQGNSGHTYGGAWVQIGKSYTPGQLSAAFRASLLAANYAVLYDANDRPGKVPG